MCTNIPAYFEELVLHFVQGNANALHSFMSWLGFFKKKNITKKSKVQYLCKINLKYFILRQASL